MLLPEGSVQKTTNQKQFVHRAAFIHGRPGPHPFHRALGEMVNADFYFVDFIMRWHDRATSRPYRYLSMLVCGLFFPKFIQYDVIISEGLHSVPVLAKKMRRSATRPKIAALMASETLYFLKTDFYSKRTKAALLKTLSAYDALICVGPMQSELAEDVLSSYPKRPTIFSIAGSSTTPERENRLAELTPDLSSKNILFIANGLLGWRAWYKGIDILLDAVGIVAERVPEINITIVGEWSEHDIREILVASPTCREHVRFTGKTVEIEGYLAKAALYVHTGRGDAFPVSVLEAMLAGVPCLVSDITGAKAAVAQADSRLIVAADPNEVAKKILWYLGLPLEEKMLISTTSREVARQYNEEAITSEFLGIVKELVSSV